MKNHSIHDAIAQITGELAAITDTPRLDAELLATSVLPYSRAGLLAHGEKILTPTQQQQLQALAMRRAHGEPMAYILGQQAFWNLTLTVNTDVLIPRPETEHLIEWILANFPADAPLQIADLGAGSGAIALALAAERPAWQIDAIDLSASALTLAQQNAAQHGLHKVRFYLGDWCMALPKKNYHLLVSNPPYIAENDPHLARLTYEPQQALVAGTDGLDAIRTLISQAPGYLAHSGSLVLEHGYNQAAAVSQLAAQHGFTHIKNHLDLAKQPRFTTAIFTAPPGAKVDA